MPGLVLSQHRPTIQPTRLPSHTRSQSTDTTPQPTNTLILTSLPVEFFHPTVLDPLKAHFESYGDLHTWAPLKGFGRVIVVFWSVDDAERLRTECDGLHVGGHNSSMQTLRLYRGEMTSLELPEDGSRHLQVPAQTKNFLISPPGSPPVGWEQVEEEPPNTAALAADLVAALTRLQQHQEVEEAELQRNGGEPSRIDGKQVLLDTDRDADSLQHASASSSARPGHGRTQSGSLIVLLEDVDAVSRGRGRSGSHTPEEIIEILNPAHEMSSSRGGSPPRYQQQLPRSGMPPPGFGSITSVRATVDSMRTAMPPMQHS